MIENDKLSSFIKEIILNKSRNRNRKQYQDWIRLVYERDNYKCTVCGEKEKIVAHHIIPWDENESLRFEVNNGQTLCRKCHNIHHSKGRIMTDKHKAATRRTGRKGKKISPLIGRKMNPETVVKIVESRKWYKHSEETKVKLRANAGRPKGIPMSESTKEKLRIINTGRKHSEETRIKLRANAGRPKSKTHEVTKIGTD